MEIRSGLSSVIWWSVISAAFIGPGTVTTAAKAGSNYGLSLLWTLVFATVVCFILQESAARLSIVSYKHLGENISCVFKNRIFKLAAGLSVVFGCIAYQAGNMLGTLEGIKMIWAGNKYVLIVMIFFLCLIII